MSGSSFARSTAHDNPFLQKKPEIEQGTWNTVVGVDYSKSPPVMVAIIERPGNMTAIAEPLRQLGRSKYSTVFAPPTRAMNEHAIAEIRLHNRSKRVTYALEEIPGIQILYYGDRKDVPARRASVPKLNLVLTSHYKIKGHAQGCKIKGQKDKEKKIALCQELLRRINN